MAPAPSKIQVKHLSRFFVENGKNANGSPISSCTICSSEVIRSTFGKNCYLTHMKSKLVTEYEEAEKNFEVSAASGGESFLLSFFNVRSHDELQKR